MILCPSCKEENPPKFRLCGYCGTPLVVAAALPLREVRKTVTVVFCDLKGSTALGEALDAEALHEVKERYFAVMAAEIARHGGKVEKYIGDAIMAVFGLPRAHEDDALRAVRAAYGMHAALAAVNTELEQRFGVRLVNRTGINTGEVVAVDDAAQDQKLATGDAVNLAARLEQAAPEDGILLGESTWHLVRDAVDVEAIGEITVKGKTQPVRAWRLVSVRDGSGVRRRHDLPLVGRESELATLRAVYDEVRSQRVVRLVTVVGDAGAGKSRLIQEVLDGVAADARPLVGRCRSYGEGVTFWPLSMMLREAARIADDELRADALARLHQMIGDADVTARLASVTGLSDVSYPLHEINWAARCALQAMAAEQPVVALIDDVHWAEPALLELISHVLDKARDAPILLLATARHDLFERHPDWGLGDHATRIVLGPLADEAAASVVRQCLDTVTLPEPFIARIVRAAGGNPLYAEQFLSMLVDHGVLDEIADGSLDPDDAEMLVPPTIHALLEERVDQLGRAERAAVEPASVIGYEFEQDDLAVLTPEPIRPELRRHLDTLESKHFVHAERSAAGGAAYRFHHQLVRETVYGGLLKRTRAQLHLAFARWAEQAYLQRAFEMDEIIGYHLEQAWSYLRELGPLDDEGLAAGTKAAERLARAARRVFARGDTHAAAALFGRAIALLAPGDPARLALLPALAETLMERAEFARARELLVEAESQARGVGDELIATASRLMRLRLNLFSPEAEGQGGNSGEDTLVQARTAIPLLESRAAHPELARAWRLIGFVHGVAGRYGESSDAVMRSMVHARAAGDTRLVARNALGLATSILYGPTPVPEAIGYCESLLAQGLGDRQVESKLLCSLAQLHAMSGDFERARQLVRRGRDLLRDLGQGVNAASTGIDLAMVELLAGDLACAERDVKTDYEFLAAAGETYFLSTIAALLARLVRDQGRDEEAFELTRVAERASAADDVESQAWWRSVRAPIVARAGRLDEAQTLVREAVALSLQTDAPLLRAYTATELAVVLEMSGRIDEAGEAISNAEAISVAKGDRVSAGRASAMRQRIAQFV